MTGDALFAGLIAIWVLSGSLGVIAFRRALYALISLVWTILGVSVLYFYLGATLLATVQILLYAGAVLVLFLFVITTTDPEAPEPLERPPALVWLAILTGLVFLITVLLFSLLQLPALRTPALTPRMDQLTSGFLGTHMLAFELLSVLLLVAIVSAVFLASRPRSGGGA